MYIRIRKVVSEHPKEDLVLHVNQKSQIKHIKYELEKQTGIPWSDQKLFFRGKQLAYHDTILDYGVKLNDVVLLMVKEKQVLEPKIEHPLVINQLLSKFYKIGDKVDVRCIYLGCWFEGTIMSIEATAQRVNTSDLPAELMAENNLTFYVSSDTERFRRTNPYRIEDMRPRAFYTYKLSELTTGLRVFVNFNFDNKKKRGFWYDMRIKKINKLSLVGAILLGNGNPTIYDCKSPFIQEIMRIEPHMLITDRVGPQTLPENFRKVCPQCWSCNDVPNVDCEECGCKICSSKREQDKMLVCNECDDAIHMYCLIPPLEIYPEDGDWYCANCKNNDVIVLPVADPVEDEAPVASTSKASPTGKGKNKTRGMACAGRNSICTIVPLNHYGPIPGVEVGMTWKFRMQVSAAGVHRPSMAGIHGRSSDGAYSIILSGGYEDDFDDGYSIIYTGSGGRGLSGSKQSSDQQLTLMNKALAMNCDAKFNRNGAVAQNWKEGKPVRVLRSYKFKNSKFAPKDGIRYDGIYKVEKYYRRKGVSGHYVWRFVLKRDDVDPAPWEEDGQEYPIEYPDGYLEACSNKENAETSKTVKTKKKDKVSSGPPAKKAKITPFKLNEDLQKLIDEDTGNVGNWKECAEALMKGKQYYLNLVTQTFLCVCCQDLVLYPITTECKHNICKNCLQRSFDCQLFSCPYCRAYLGADYKVVVNLKLAGALSKLFPGYEAARNKD